MERLSSLRNVQSLIVISLEKGSNLEFNGSIYHFFQKEPQRFESVIQMLNQIDGFLDAIRFPQASFKLRTFTAKSDIERIERQKEEEILYKKGDVGTFLVHVKYRQNGSWQGQVTWAERNEKKSFRSTLELIKLLDDAVQDTDLECASGE